MNYSRGAGSDADVSTGINTVLSLREFGPCSNSHLCAAQYLLFSSWGTVSWSSELQALPTGGTLSLALLSNLKAFCVAQVQGHSTENTMCLMP
jgi:hypothetical protein